MGRGATWGIVVASATLTATRLTIAMRPWAIDSVAARFSRRALRSNWLEKAHQRHLQLQRLLRQRRLLRLRLLQLMYQRLHRLHQRLWRHQHLQRWSQNQSRSPSQSLSQELTGWFAWRHLD